MNETLRAKIAGHCRAAFSAACARLEAFRKWTDAVFFQKITSPAVLGDAADSDTAPSFRDYVLLYGISAFVLIFIIWANLATLDELARGIGKVIPSSDIQVVQNLEGGIVESFFVKEGDIVEKGQRLLQMNDIRAGSEYQATLKKVQSLQAAIARLKAEIEGGDIDLPAESSSAAVEAAALAANRLQHEDQRKVLEQQLDQRRQEAAGIEEKIVGMKRMLDLSNEEKTMIEPMIARGTVSKVELLQLNSKIAEQETQMSNLQAALASARAAVTEAEERISAHGSTQKADAQKELAGRMAELEGYQETLAAFEDRSKRTEIRAPVRGKIKDIKVTTVGGVVQPGQDILEIVPLDDQLIIEAEISPTDIAFLYPGQKATVKFTAYDFSIYGDMPAEVSEISADTIKNDRDESFYRVKLVCADTAIHYKGETLPIIPGMVANVDIMTGKKTVMSYILKRFKNTLTNAMHER